MVDLRALGGQSRKVRGDTRRYQASVDALDPLAVRHCTLLWYDRKVKAISPVELCVDEAWRKDPAAEINYLFRGGAMFVQNMLSVEDLSTQ